MKNLTITFKISIVMALLFVLWGTFFPTNLGQVMESAQTFFLTSFGWFYQLAASFFLLFALFLIFSKYGKIKLGKEHDKPEFNRLTWFAMLFSAGMGIGLLFYGVSEPISHYAEPPYGGEELARTSEAALIALRFTYLHWGFHAWAIYATVALALAYYKFRKQVPGLMSSTLQPIFGDKVRGPIGYTIDIIAVFATLFGVCASLGLGAQQINAGLNYLIGIPINFNIQLLIIGIITVLFIISASTGIKKGIKYLSNTNMILAVLLLIIMIIVGPTLFLLNLFTHTLGQYIQNLPQMGLRISPFNQESAAWTQGWTIFYWAWWISWSPFVGMFIARVSKGRTVREFVVAVLIVPTLVCAFWFAIFGGTGIYFDLIEGLDVAGQSLETGLFYVYNFLPLGGVLSVLTVLLISTFFITSADSATFVLGMQTTEGDLNPSVFIKISWGLILSASAVVLMASGGLDALQTAIIVSAFPLTFILLAMSYSILKVFKLEMKAAQKK
ncbi:OpuD, BCCT family glycine betaine transporter [Alkalihalophilus pseudofirmus OF4]|uniref:OpuD, BCCT family glycine betaine transporter n=1 Tax=Alkalihalophilus pseudofirmus (strain ATCC BAA-2126 / JCM 17055 / OF4) TaxID=398511 RepID=D3FUA6_ALKPO|nr:BCCT family transporter [Alkalihalophilus pseudofirmus]ADC48308.1 OpuD, BCCT family glycine betaine transporter [Alkalihalophilus pseudofirmus OF4]